MMLPQVQSLVAAPGLESEDKSRAAGLLNVILLSQIATALVVVSILVIINPTGALLNLTILVIVVTISWGLRVLVHRGHIRTASLLLSSFMLAITTAMIFIFGGIRSNTTSVYFVVVAVAALLLGGRAAVIFSLLSMLATLGVFYAEINDAIVFTMPTLNSFSDWIILSATLSVETLLLRFAVRSITEGFERARHSAQALFENNRQLQAHSEALQAQTRELARRARYLETTAVVARDATSFLDLQELLSRAATLISERFGFYHTGIFLLNLGGEWAELRAASSAGGRRMLARGYQVRTGGPSVVGYVTGRGEPRIALDTGADAVIFDDPDLPDTRSQVTLPLQARGEIIGALDVQSPEPEAFSDEDVAVLQTLADQIAMAISNARLYEAIEQELTERARAEETLKQRAIELAILNDIGEKITAVLELDGVIETAARLVQNSFGYHHVAFFNLDRERGELVLKAQTGAFTHLFPLEHRLKLDQGLVGWVGLHGETLLVNDVEAEPRYVNPYPAAVPTQSELSVPIRAGGEIVGVLDIHSPYPQAFDKNDAMLLETLAYQIAVAIENARLYEVLQQELTERKRAEEELARQAQELARSNAELDNFARVVSHDLQEPLRKVQIIGDRLQAMYAGSLDDRGRDYTERMQHTAQRMQNLINDLLTYSRVTSQAEPFTLVDLNQVVRGVLSDLEARIEQVGGQVQVGDLPTIDADPTQMRQLLQNLIGNALKFHHPDVALIVQVHGQITNNQERPSSKNAPDQAFCQITVADNGIGFDEKYLDRLFQAFQRLHSRDEYEGTGIGLATCRKIVERHGGNITAKSRPGQGATFIVTLPVTQPQGETQ